MCSSKQIRSLFHAKCLYCSVKGSGITTNATVAAVATAPIAAAAAAAAAPATPPT